METIAPGLLTTVQDLGREGFGPLGVSPSGASDALSLRVGNLLVGNTQDAAGLEMTLLGGTFRFPQGASLAIAGSDFGASLGGDPVRAWEAIEAGPGQTLRMGPTSSGARCYLCVRGGIAVKPFLGSASTHLLSRLGGFEGRSLRQGDMLSIGSDGASEQAPFRPRTLPSKFVERLAPRTTVRVTPGPQNDWFSESARQLLYEGAYQVTEESNRMGIRLSGMPIPCPRGGEMITEGVSLGAIQLPPSGQPIILFVEQQTTGGYPKIANVISADMHSLGQLRPRDEIRFERVEFATAIDLLREQEQMLAELEALLR